MRFLPLLALLLTSISLSAQRYQVLIHEVFADPTPSVGLPNHEWIEIRNRTITPINLQGWRVSDAGGQSGPLPATTLLPDSLLLLCSPSAVSALSSYGRVVGVSGFPSLDNDGECLVLRNAAGQVVHALDYSADWHATELKKEGGWSLEMIDPALPGSFQPNWSSSVHPVGGSPGKPNSIARPLIDLDPPVLTKGYALDSARLLVFFDEAVDSSAISQEGLFHLSNNREIVEARCLPPLYDRVELRTDWPLLPQTVYTLTNIEVTDILGNRSHTNQSIRLGIPSTPDSADIRINELLFDPPSGASDYVEMINRGKKIIDLSRLHLSNRSVNGSLGNILRVSNEPAYFFPGDHLVLTADPRALTRYYFAEQPEWIRKTTALPSLPDTEGSLVVLNGQGVLLDELRYHADWHYPRLQSRMGVALERIDPAGRTQDRNNWQSAASTVGYGTPTRRNSQYRSFLSEQEIEISAPVFSPDGDGREDVTQIRIRLREPASRLRVRIFHASGVPVRELANGVLAGTESVFKWDGLDDKGNRLPEAPYILLTERIDKNGRTDRQKDRIALVSRH